MIKSSQEDSMVNGIEGSGKVKQSQYCDFASDDRMSLWILRKAVHGFTGQESNANFLHGYNFIHSTERGRLSIGDSMKHHAYIQ